MKEVKQPKEMGKEEKAFLDYQDTLDWIDRRQEPKTAEFYNESPEVWKKAKLAVFVLYQRLRDLFGELPTLGKCLNRDKKEGIPPYKFEDGDTEFPCVGVLGYRGMEFPVYDDDYGMDMFIVVDGRCLQVDSFGGETDWYFELDRIIDKIEG